MYLEILKLLHLKNFQHELLQDAVISKVSKHLQYWMITALFVNDNKDEWDIVIDKREMVAVQTER